MRRAAGGLLPLALALLAAPLAAQHEPAPIGAEPLPLERALRLAEDANPALRRARSEIQRADAEVRSSRGAFLPQASASLGTGGFNQRSVTGEDPFGRIVRLDDPAEFTRSSSSQQVALQGIPLFDGGRRLRDARAAGASARASRHGAEAEAGRVRAEVARRYYGAVRAHGAIALEERLREAAAERLEIARRQLRVAVGSPVDVLGAEIDLARQEQALERARGEARKALLALGEAMGVAAGERFHPSDPLPAPFDPAEAGLEARLDAALAASPRLLRLQEETLAAEHRSRAARAARWPQLSGFLALSRSVGGQGQEALFELNPLNRTVNFGVTASLPLFDGWQRAGVVAQADAGRLAAREELRAGQLALERELGSAAIDLRHAARGAALAERAGALARERIAMAREQFRLGLIGFTELQAVVEQGAQTERDALAARHDFAAALVTLEELLGEPLPAPAVLAPRP